MTLLALVLACNSSPPSTDTQPADSGVDGDTAPDLDGGSAPDGGTATDGGSTDGGGEEEDILGLPDGEAGLCAELGKDLPHLELPSVHGRAYFWQPRAAYTDTQPGFMLAIQAASGDATVCPDPHDWSWNWDPVDGELYSVLTWSMPPSDPNQWVGAYDWFYDAQYLNRVVEYLEAFAVYIAWHEDWYERHYGEELLWVAPADYWEDEVLMCVTELTPTTFKAQVVWFFGEDRNYPDDPGYLLSYEATFDEITEEDPDPCVAMKSAVDEGLVWSGEWE